jgi:type IV pilus assembly protein PilA
MQLQRRWVRGVLLLVQSLAIFSVLIVLTVPIVVRPGRNTQTAREVVAILKIQAIHREQAQHLSRFGKYAASLEELGLPIGGAEKSGYLFTLKETPEGYPINANPKVFGSTGRRTFYLDQNGVIHHNWGPEPATTNSPEIGK